MERKLKHLEFIQEVINRMARNSFMLKGWTVILVGAIVAFIARGGNAEYILLVCIPALAFWALDGFFLSQEGLFRSLYDRVRMLDESEVDFSMDTREFSEIRRNKWLVAMFSRTLNWFYIPIIMIVFAVAILLLCAERC